MKMTFSSDCLNFRKLNAAFGFVLGGLLASLGTSISAQPSDESPNYFFVQKVQQSQQTGPGAAASDPTRAFGFGAISTKAGLTLTTPTGQSFPLVYVARDENYNFGRTFPTKAALDAAFPNGVYQLSGPGFETISITLTGDLYPPAPVVTGGTWNAGGALLLTPATAATVNFAPFPGYATSGGMGRIYAEVYPDSKQVFSKILPGGFAALYSAVPFTSIAIPASVLPNNSSRGGSIEYSTLATLDLTTIPGSIIGAFYHSNVDFDIASVATGTGGNPPAITRQPADQAVALGTSATFAVTATFGTAAGQAPSYTWRFNGSYIDTNGGDPKYSTAADGSLTVKNIVAADEGNYAVRVQNTGGSTGSRVAALSVTNLPAKPIVTTPPQSQTVGVGQTTTLTVVASGGATNTYQWNKDGLGIVGATGSTLALTNVQAAAAGSYTVTIRNDSGSVTSDAAVVTVSSGPGIATQPKSQNIGAGTSVTLSVASSGTGATYQWNKNGVAISGATGASYVIGNPQTGDMGFYSCTVTSGGKSTDSATATVTVTGGTPARPINISTRALVTTAEPLTAGFVLSSAKTVLVRASGPGLVQFGVPGTMNDPKLEIIPLGSTTGTPIASNNDWGGASNLAAITTATAASGAFAFPAGSKDAAVLATLPAGGYTARVTGADGGGGIALVEVYDTDALSSPGQLINISARATVGTGASALATGFVVSGVAPRQVLIRAIGPGLTQFGVPSILADPQLTLIPAGANFSIAGNDNWGGSAELKAAAASVGAFAISEESKDAVILVRLPPGGYTAVVAGVGGTTGTAIVEVYDLGP